MRRQMFKSKLHRATVTQADLEYEGSVTLDQNLMEAADILEHEAVHIWNVTQGTRLQTYALKGVRGSGVCCVNGAAAHLCNPGDKVIIATKLGIEMAPGKKGLSRKYMMQAVEDSLQRLQTDYIDLYQSHRDDPDTAIEETLSAYADLIKAGKVREIGASNFSAERLAESLKISTEKGLPRYQSLQPHYSLVERQEFEGPLEDLCLKEKIGTIGYYSLASGFLTGKYRAASDTQGKARGSRVEKYMNDYGFGVIAALDDVAKRYNTKPVQIALAWLIARPSVTAPIASATTLEQLGELLKAAEIKLDAAAIAQIDAASKPR